MRHRFELLVAYKLPRPSEATPTALTAGENATADTTVDEHDVEPAVLIVVSPHFDIAARLVLLQKELAGHNTGVATPTGQ